MNHSNLNTEYAPKLVLEVEEAQHKLWRAQMDLFFAQLQLNLMKIEDLHAELPMFLRQLKQQFSCPEMPEYCLVICYPFSQECLIFHALEESLPQRDLRALQEQLLPRSSQLTVLEPQHDQLYGHHCQMLFAGHNYAVWRVYLNYAEAQTFNSELLQQLDFHVQQGFQQRAQQQQKIQAILQQERREFSAELHDSIAQIIGFLRLKSAQLNQQCRQQEIFLPLLEQSEELASYTHYAYQQVRELITASRLTYQELDFLTALKKILGEFEHQSSIAFELDNRAALLKVSAKQSVQLLYIVRESLSNIVRHSHATVAIISIRQHVLNSGLHQLLIAISDNGRGMQPGMKRQDSFGLEIMQERAERIGANFSIVPNQPCGTRVQVALEINSSNMRGKAHD